MSIEGLEHYSKDQLIEELINRQTFVGIVIFHREDAKDGQLSSGEIVMTKSPPLTREGVERYLQVGQSLVPAMFGNDSGGEVDVTAGVLPLPSMHSPIRLDQGGILRVGGSRVSFDLIVEQYENGVTPEDMVRAYDTLDLAEVYGAIAYYLRHRPLVQAYLHSRAMEAGALRTVVDSRREQVTREELLQRRLAREKDHAATGR